MSLRFAFENPGTEPIACCPEWSTDDYILWGIYEFLEGGEYAVMFCPHCETVRHIELPVSAWTIEKERDMKFQSEREAVDDIIAEEKLTVKEIVERMPEGWTLVSEEHFNQVVKIKNDNFEAYNKLRARMSNMRLALLTAAMRLGEQGGATHRDKDEATLRVIAQILRCARECDEAHEDGYTDDIPF